MNGKRNGSCPSPPTPPLAKRLCQPQPPPLSCGPQQDPQRLNQLHKPPQPFGDVSSPVRVASSSPAEINGGPQHLKQFPRPPQPFGGYSCGASSCPEEFHDGPRQVPQPFNQCPRPPQPFNHFNRPPQRFNQCHRPQQPVNQFNRPPQRFNQFYRPPQPANQFPRPPQPVKQCHRPPQPANLCPRPPQPANQFHRPQQPFNQFHRHPQQFGCGTSSSPEELSVPLSPRFDLRDRLDFYAKAMLIDFAYDLFRRLVRVGICPDVLFESRVELERTVNQFLFERWEKDNLPAPAANNGKVGISPAAEHSQKVDIAGPFKEQNSSVALVSNTNGSEDINPDVAKPDKATGNDTSSVSTPAPNLPSPSDTMLTTLASKPPLKDIATMADLKPTQANKQTMTVPLPLTNIAIKADVKPVQSCKQTMILPLSLKTSWTMTSPQGCGPATVAAHGGNASKTSAYPAQRKLPGPVPRKIRRGQMLTETLEKKETGTSTDFVDKTDAETCTDVIENNDADTMTKEVEKTERGTLTAVTTSDKTTSTDPSQLSWAENVSLVDIAPRARSENETQTETTQIMTKSLPLETNIVDNSSRGTQEVEGGTDCPNHSSLDQGTSKSMVRISIKIKIGKGLNARVV